MDEPRTWPALVISARHPAPSSVEGPGLDDLLAALLDDFAPAAIEDLAELPLPPGGLWDPTYPPIPEPPPAPLNWRVFFTDEDTRNRTAAAVSARFPEVGLAIEQVPDENWAARTQQALRAIQAGTFVVAPPWDLPTDLASGLTTIVVEPSRGFGTGHHASTRLCLQALSDIDVRGRRVLDLGTGSGVLAMGCVLRRARQVTAVDVDPDAIESARASAAMNDLPIEVEFAVCDFREAGDRQSGAKTGLHRGAYDLVLANLTGGMLVSSASRIEELLAPGGTLVMSGFDDGERRQVRAAFRTMQDANVLSEEEWICLVLRK